MHTRTTYPISLRTTIAYALCSILAGGLSVAAPLQVLIASAPVEPVHPDAAQFCFVCTHGGGVTEVSSDSAEYRWYVKNVNTGGDFVEVAQGMTYCGTDLAAGTYVVKAECSLHDIPGDPDNGTAAHAASHESNVQILAAADDPHPVNLRTDFLGDYRSFGPYRGIVVAVTWQSSDFHIEYHSDGDPDGMTSLGTIEHYRRIRRVEVPDSGPPTDFIWWYELLHCDPNKVIWHPELLYD